ncbi:hypothetical protein HON52_02310 [Candidatus Uhrbacteria bacterium]|jgi:hypothetical protein|nr:hypothetical protein [Candidatus Uhrbacteria bacterium]
MKKDVLSVIGVVAILILLAAYFAFSKSAPQIGYKPVDLDGGSILVEDQDATETVTLDAELSEPGWITVHFSMSGAPAEVVGVSEYLEAGAYDDMVINLDEEMTKGWRYITLLHVDNGDQVFDIEDDLPVSVNGEVVRPSFVSFPSEISDEITVE